MRQNKVGHVIIKLSFLILFISCSTLVLNEKSFAQCSGTLGGNLVANGNFESAVSGTESGFSYNSGGANGPGTWGISLPVSSGSSYQPATVTPFGSPGDHTCGCSSGKYMLIDADGTSPVAWQSTNTISVTAGTTYFFSAWIANINQSNKNQSTLKFFIDGIDVSPGTVVSPPGPGPTASNSDADHSWVQFYTSWVAPTTKNIVIKMQNTNLSGTGNDLALDDITFSTSCQFVQQLKLSQLPSKFYVCNGSAVTLDSKVPSASTTFNWTFNGASVGGSTPTYLTGAPAIGRYILCYTRNSCTQKDTVDVVNGPIPITVTAVSPSKCGDPGTLKIGDLPPGSPYTVKYTNGSVVTLTNQIPDAQGKINISGPVGTYSNIEVSAFGCASNKVNGTLVNPPSMVINFNGIAYPSKASCSATWTVKLYGVLNDTYQNVTINGVTSLIQSNSSSTPYIQLDNPYLTAGSYVFSVTDTSTNCTSNSLSLNLVNDDIPAISLTATDPSCPPNNDGTITISGLTTGDSYYINYSLNGVAQTKLTSRTAVSPGKYVMTGLIGGSYSNLSVGISSSCSSNAAGISLTPCPLPVEFITFTGQIEGSRNVLSWFTASEKDNNYFTVERSINGSDFISIGTVQGHGNSTSIQSYHFDDQHSFNGTNYYRLKQVDFNGSVTYSHTIAIDNKEVDMDIYPNPNQGAFTIRFIAPGESYKLEVTDVLGKAVYSISGQTVPESVEVNDLAKGVYLVRFYQNNKAVIKKMMVY